MSEFTRITVLGTGVLGSQIAYQTAFSGFDVVAYDIDDAALDAARQRFTKLADLYAKDVAGGGDGKAEEALGRITYSSDLAEAVADADLVIEAVPEKLEIKQETYEKLAAAAPERTVFATNSSTLLPSSLVEFTGRPAKFLALHFANKVWQFNTAEVMGTEKTDPEVFRSVVRFAEEIGMVPIEIHKEKAGYVLNSLLVPFLQAASQLYAQGIADPETVDKTWRIGTGAPAGPFEIYDVVGLTTAYNISAASPDPAQQEFARILKERFIDQGKLGVATGEGFYKYPRE
ncbi:3-hydroxyacyl-CoA dehydrogenase [Rhodococcus rhodnii]|uniref:3-hydroxybutyryl-CoA dehydrogenase n=2 Tax=Rhodococcus rhodnii TaxID=38312 RepID=R7WJ65_9NOCA|nr:3-hydroxyacyl-CoA dehydrogenase [Rhodococcus rhodnii]EOM75302.1 3-hydroxybutyryl-CoA dehydrogenase [Rhodococcus rhodnii LMG 5362]TXG89959.1 3-hydroxyacyl-CoA dehydrogenase [Rhodococcus rhodnii]